MNLAVLKFQYDEQQPAGMPDEWPSKVVEIGESTELPEQCPEEDGWIVMSLAEYNAHKATHQSAFNTWWSTYSAPTATDIVKAKILAAMEFGRSVIAEEGAKNTLSGYSLAQIKDIMARTTNVQNALNTGSLYVAIDELALVQTDETLITPAKLTVVRNKIQTYLGIPLT